MAIDSAQKRASTVSALDALMVERRPTATNLADAANRGAGTFMYYGIAAGAAPAGATSTGGARRSMAALAMRNAVFTAQRGG